MKYLVIGSSAAGMAAAVNLRRMDPASEVTMVSRDLSFHSRCQLHLVVSGERRPDEILFIDPRRVGVRPAFRTCSPRATSPRRLMRCQAE